MRIANLDTASGFRLAAITGGFAVDLNRAVQLSLREDSPTRLGVRSQSEAIMPSTIYAWLALDAEVRTRKATESLALGAQLLSGKGARWAATHQLAFPLDSVVLGPPIPEQASVFAIGLNFADHASEADLKLPEYPVVFTKPATTLGGHDGFVRIPPSSFRIDYEGEVVIIIGETCRNVSESSALDYVAGYTLANDVSARDWQFRTSEMMIGKAFDGFCPMGPWLVTASQVPDPSQLTFETSVNGDPRQNGKLTGLVFSVAKLISYLSQAVTLQPGDAILTGTPAGIGATRASGKWLKPGDKVTISSPQLGELTTTFAQ